MQHRLGVFALCGVLAALAGCAATQPTQILPTSNESIVAFSLNGRVAVKLDDRGYTASLRWHHTATRDSLRLLSPVGSVVGEIEADSNGATLTTGDNKVYRSNDVQALTREVLGWDLPLAGLRYWVTGRADPAVPVQAEDRDDRQRLKSLMQNDWRIAYVEYFGDSALPARLGLIYERLNLRLIIERWELPE
jgi:outer membrane lipoprotein LolB